MKSCVYFDAIREKHFLFFFCAFSHKHQVWHSSPWSCSGCRPALKSCSLRTSGSAHVTSGALGDFTSSESINAAPKVTLAAAAHTAALAAHLQRPP